MGYEQGAFLTRAAKPLQFVAGHYDFTDDVITQLADLDVIGGEIDLLFPDLLDLAKDTSDPLDGMDLDDANLQVTILEISSLVTDVSAIVDAVDATDAQFAGVVASAPAEAWTDPPHPFVVPAAPQLDTPALPSTFPVTQIQQAVVPAAGSTGDGVSRALVLINLTQYGNENFRTSDSWLIQASGKPGDAVTVNAYVNGSFIGQETVGNIGADGRYEQTGTFQAGDVGAWREVWSVGGVGVAAVNFIVSS